MNFFTNRIKENLSQPDLMIFRLIMSYLICLILYLRHEKIYFNDFEFFRSESLPVLLSGTAILFLIWNLVRSRRVICLSFICMLTLYCYLAISENRTSSFLFGCIAVMAFFVFFTGITDFRLRLPGWYVWTAAVTLMIAVCLFVSISCIMSYEENCTSCYDFGIFSQMFYYLKKCGLPLVTCERDGLLSHFAVHVSPIFYLLLPIYVLFPDPRTLLVMQCVVTFSGVIPLILIGRKHRISNLASLVFAVIYLLYPSFTGASFYYIHENNFLPPLILWLVYFLEKEKRESDHRGRNKIICILSAIFVFGVKEDAAVYVAVISLYFLVVALKCVYKERKKWITLLNDPSLWIFILSLIYFIAVTSFLAAKGDGVMTGRYDNYIYDGSGSLLVMLLGIIKNPVYVVSQCASTEKLSFLAYMLLPLGLMPLFCQKMERWILMIPLLLFNLMTAYTYQYSIYYQYAFGSGALLVYLAMINYEDMNDDVSVTAGRGSLGRKLLAFSMISVLLIYGFHFGEKAHFYKEIYRTDKAYRESVKEALELIPDDASVAAGTYLVPVLSQRDVIYELDTTEQKAEYYVLDLRDNDNSAVYDDDPDYELLYYTENVIAVYRYKESSVLIQ